MKAGPNPSYSSPFSHCPGRVPAGTPYPGLNPRRPGKGAVLSPPPSRAASVRVMLQKQVLKDCPQSPARPCGAHSPPRARGASAAAASHPVFAATWERWGSRLSLAAPPLAPSGRRKRAGSLAPPRLGLPQPSGPRPGGPRVAASARKAKKANRCAAAVSLPLSPGCSGFPAPPAGKFSAFGASALKKQVARRYRRARPRPPAHARQGAGWTCACAARRCRDRWLICMSPPRAAAAGAVAKVVAGALASAGATPHSVGSG